MQRHYPGRFGGKVALLMGVGRGSTKEAAVRMAAEGADMVLTDIVKEFVDKASDDASYLTGQTISVSGGLSMF